MPADHKRKIASAWPIWLLIGIVFALCLPALLPHIRGQAYHSLESALGSPNSVKHLYLDEKGYSTVPPEIKQFINMDYLSLAGNKITQLPQWLSQNDNVVFLCLDGNQIEVIPSRLLEMKKLKWLYLAGNKISSLPPDIGKLNTLLELDLANNNLTDIPDEISQLTNLGVLSLGQNRLSPSTISRVQKLLPNTQIEIGEQRE